MGHLRALLHPMDVRLEAFASGAVKWHPNPHASATKLKSQVHRQVAFPCQLCSHKFHRTVFPAFPRRGLGPKLSNDVSGFWVSGLGIDKALGGPDAHPESDLLGHRATLCLHREFNRRYDTKI